MRPRKFRRGSRPISDLGKAVVAGIEGKRVE
jgi:hypothetical protein